MKNSLADNIPLIDNYKAWIKETNPAVLKALMTNWLSECGFQVLNFTEHHFHPHGYTCLWLLGESHLAIHTFPERETCYVELSSCNAGKNKKFQLLLKECFQEPEAR